MLFWTITVTLLLLLLPCLALLGVWLFHLSSAINVCETVSTVGTGAAGQFSLEGLGRCRECEFTSIDGLTLRGTYVRRHTRQRRGVVVFCHEFGGDRHVAAPYVARVLDNGFDVFAFDFRNHGTSDRMEDYSPRTWATQYEVYDVQGAINYVRSCDDADPVGVALMGLSRGACAALSAARHTKGVWALITDGAFESRWVTTAYIRRFMPQFVRLAPVLNYLPWFLQVLYGTFVHNIVAQRLKHPCIRLKNDVHHVRQPVLMIHGERDHTIPVELTHRLWGRLRRSARLWIVPKGSHNRSLRSDPEAYQQRICRFLKKHAPRRVLQAPYSVPVAVPEAASFAARSPKPRASSPVWA